MARALYGCTSADFTLTAGGRLSPGAVLTLWTARTGGTRITDLLTVDGTPITEVVSGADASIAYQGPDNDKSVHWADSGVGERVAIRPVEIIGATGATPVLSMGTVGTGAAGATLTGTVEEPVLNLVLPTAGANGVGTAALQDGSVTAAKLADRYRLENRVGFADASVVCAAATRHLAQTGTMTAPRTVTLPAAAAVPAGAEIIIADESGTVTPTNTITITRAGTDLINGATTMVIGQAYGWRRLVSDGVSRWAVNGGVLRASNNLADVSSPATSLTNLGGAAAATVGNLLTANQAKPTTTGGYELIGSASEIAAGVYQATGSGAMSVHNGGAAGAVAIIGGQVVTAMVQYVATARTARVRVVFYTAGNALTGSTVDGNFIAGPGWSMLTTVAPADAAKALIYPVVSSTGAAGDTVTVSKVGLWHGAGGAWVPPGTPVPNLGIRANPADPTQVQVWNPGNSTWITV